MTKDLIQLTPPGACIDYWPSFLSEEYSRNLFQILMSEIPWRHDSIQLFGKHVALPRLQAWYGGKDCPYSYSGLELAPLPWTDPLLDVKRKIERHSGYAFNSVLINLYRDGKDSNGWHSDDEPELGPDPVIASLSLGETRRFRLRHLNNKSIPPIALDLTDGSLLLMSGPTQHHWQHCLAKTARAVGPRINLTFRTIIHAN